MNPPIRLLVAEDHTIVREGLVSILEREPDMIVVAEASNGLEAMEQFRLHHPDVVLVDLHMPLMSSFDLVIALRAENPQARIILLITYDGDEAIYPCLQAGAKTYLLKEVPRAELCQTIRTVYLEQTIVSSKIGTQRAEQADVLPLLSCEQNEANLKNDLSIQKRAVISQFGASNTPIEALDISLDYDVFLQEFIRALSGILQDVVGLEQASDFISWVGMHVGRQIDQAYKSALHVPSLSQEQVTQVLVDVKKRLQGDFYVIEETTEKIVFGNRACPFGERVHGRSSICMMTSNVFGSIVAENLGYAKVELQETIAKGAAGCRVVIYLQPIATVEGREYLKA